MDYKEKFTRNFLILTLKNVKKSGRLTNKQIRICKKLDN